MPYVLSTSGGFRKSHHGYGLKRITAPTEYPITLSEAMRHARVDGSADPSELTDLFIPAAVEAVEHITHRQLVTATWDLTIARWARQMFLPLGQLQSVTSITYYDIDNNSQTLSSSLYLVNTSQEPGFVRVKSDTTLPSLYDREDAITIRFVCGYGAASAVPHDLKLAILSILTDQYEHRGDEPANTEHARAAAALYRLGDSMMEYATE